MRSLVSYSFMFLAERLSPPVLQIGLRFTSKQMGPEYPTLYAFFSCGAAHLFDRAFLQI
tara:strand:- start:6585 stop:6761 length:177 start_codon:yes stop_codon:yes gene_type:complete